MRTFLIIIFAAFAASCAQETADVEVGTSTKAIEACGPTDDPDNDGIPNGADNSQTDSCLIDATGLHDNDCSTGAGDGIPECE